MASAKTLFRNSVREAHPYKPKILAPEVNETRPSISLTPFPALYLILGNSQKLTSLWTTWPFPSSTAHSDSMIPMSNSPWLSLTVSRNTSIPSLHSQAPLWESHFFRPLRFSLAISVLITQAAPSQGRCISLFGAPYQALVPSCRAYPYDAWPDMQLLELRLLGKEWWFGDESYTSHRNLFHHVKRRRGQNTGTATLPDVRVWTIDVQWFPTRRSEHCSKHRWPNWQA